MDYNKPKHNNYDLLVRRWGNQGSKGKGLSSQKVKQKEEEQVGRALACVRLCFLAWISLSGSVALVKSHHLSGPQPPFLLEPMLIFIGISQVQAYSQKFIYKGGGSPYNMGGKELFSFCISILRVRELIISQAIPPPFHKMFVRNLLLPKALQFWGSLG